MPFHRRRQNKTIWPQNRGGLHGILFLIVHPLGASSPVLPLPSLPLRLSVSLMTRQSALGETSPTPLPACQRMKSRYGERETLRGAKVRTPPAPKLFLSFFPLGRVSYKPCWGLQHQEGNGGFGAVQGLTPVVQSVRVLSALPS